MRSGIVHALIVLTACGLGLPAQAQPAATRAAQSDDAPDVVTYGRRDDVLTFARRTAEIEGLDEAWVSAQLASARYQPSVARLVMPPAAGTAKNWQAYRARFVESQRCARRPALLANP